MVCIKIHSFIVLCYSRFQALAWWLKSNCVCLLSHVQQFAALWTVAYQAPLSIGFTMQETGVVAISSLRGSSWPRDWTHLSHIFCTGRWSLSQLNHPGLGKPMSNSFPGGSAVMNLPASVGDTGLIPGSRKGTCKKWQPTPVFLPGKSQGRRAWKVTVLGVTKESDMT